MAAFLSSIRDTLTMASPMRMSIGSLVSSVFERNTPEPKQAAKASNTSKVAAKALKPKNRGVSKAGKKPAKVKAEAPQSPPEAPKIKILIEPVPGSVDEPVFPSLSPSPSPEKAAPVKRAASQKLKKAAPEKEAAEKKAPVEKKKAPAPKKPATVTAVPKIKVEKEEPSMSLRRKSHKSGFYNEKNQTLKAWVKGKGTKQQPYVIV